MLAGGGHAIDRPGVGPVPGGGDGDRVRAAGRCRRSGSCPGTSGGASGPGRPGSPAIVDTVKRARSRHRLPPGGVDRPRGRRVLGRRLVGERPRRRAPGGHRLDLDGIGFGNAVVSQVADHRRRRARPSGARRRRRAAHVRAGRHRLAPRAAAGLLDPPQLALRPVGDPPGAGRGHLRVHRRLAAPHVPPDPVRRHERGARQRRDADADRPGGRAGAEARVPRRLGGGRRRRPGLTWSNDNPYAVLRPRARPAHRLRLRRLAEGGGRGQVLDVEVVGVEPVGDIVPSDHYGVLATLRA